MRPSRNTLWVLSAWVLFVGAYTIASLAVPRGPRLTAVGDVIQCLVPLFANMGLLLSASTLNWRRNAFWMLLALGCSLWMVGQLAWTYFEVYLHQPVPNPFIGDVIMFVHVLPMIGALALQPHKEIADRKFRFGQLDFILLLLWWVYLYAFVVIPWQYVQPNPSTYLTSYVQLASFENFVLLAGLAVLTFRAMGGWRTAYAHLFGAATLYALASEAINIAIVKNKYYTGSLYDVPLVASFVWFGTAGILARRLCPSPARAPRASEAEEAAGLVAQERRPENPWPARLAMAAIFSLPVLAVWSLEWSAAPEAVRRFRVLVTLVAILPLSFLVFLRQRLVDADRLRLLRASQDSIESLKRLQSQFVQAEKLASLGQLAAGAAHEINNPLTAILGYSDLLIDDSSLGEKPQSIARKIRDQARRTKTLVNHLLSFARRVPAERTLVDVNAILSSAVQLRGLDLRGKNITIDLQTEGVLPAVRGDANQLVQVFFNIISNAVDAMEPNGGVLMVRTSRERGSVIIVFSDNGPGVKEPERVFDPFYTTKPVGKGTGLGLSICYGSVKEHGGQITCFNRPEGGATFRIELPATLTALPVRDLVSVTSTRS